MLWLSCFSAMTDHSGAVAKVDGGAILTAACQSSSLPTADRDDDLFVATPATLAPSPSPPQPKAPSSSHTGRKCEANNATNGPVPVAAVRDSALQSGARPKEVQKPRQLADPIRKRVDAALGPSQPFRARPVPVRILTDVYKQQIRAGEEVRQLRARARAEEMLRCSALPFSFREPLFQRQRSRPDVPVPHAPVCKALPKTSRHASPVLDTSQEDCKKSRRRSQSCPAPHQKAPPKRAAKAPSALAMVKPNMALVLRQQSSLEQQREIQKQREEDERRERSRAVIKSRLKQQMRLLASHFSRLHSCNSMKDRLRAHRIAAIQRDEDYHQELRDMQDRVFSSALLVERQACYGAQRHLEQRYERKLRELGIDQDFLETKASLHVQRRRSGSLDSRFVATSLPASSPSHSRQGTSAAGLQELPRSASLLSSTASGEQSDTESARGSCVDLSQASRNAEGDQSSAESAPASGTHTSSLNA